MRRVKIGKLLKERKRGKDSREEGKKDMEERLTD
jgi:hypothetical protein